MRLFARIRRTGIVTEPLPAGAAGCVWLAREIDTRARALFGRALAIRQVDAGSCNGCELEIAGLSGPVYDMERFGLHIVASPRHADMLLVTGPVTRNMAVPLRKTSVGRCLCLSHSEFGSCWLHSSDALSPYTRRRNPFSSPVHI